MKVKKRSETAWTGELGGAFDDLTLEIKAFLFSARKELFQESVNVKVSGGITDLGLDAGAMLKKNDQRIMDSIVGWKNFTYEETGEAIKCNNETKKKYLADIMHLPTGIEKPREDGLPDGVDDAPGTCYTLTEYIDWFSGTLENFVKN